MKTSIIISGPKESNDILRNVIINETPYAEEWRREAKGYEIVFETKKEAKRSLWTVFKYLKSTVDRPLRFSKIGELYYDESKAIITRVK